MFSPVYCLHGNDGGHYRHTYTYFLLDVTPRNSTKKTLQVYHDFYLSISCCKVSGIVDLSIVICEMPTVGIDSFQYISICLWTTRSLHISN